MDYIKIRFGNEFGRLGSRLDHAMEECFRPRPVSPMFASYQRTWSPQMDIYETPEEIIIRAEVAGVKKEDLDVEINSRAVKISGSRQEIHSIQNSTYRLAEIQYGEFERILYLPAPIDTEIVSSTYADGFLQLRLAKLPLGRTHKIPISDG